MNEYHSQKFFVPTYGGPLTLDLRFRREFLGEHAVLVNHHRREWQSGSVGGLVIHIHSLNDVALVLKEIEESKGQLFLADTPDTLLSGIRSKKTGVMICASFDDVGLNPDLLTIYSRLGVVSFALSLNNRNMLVDGCAERTQSGLSTLGLKVVQDLFERGILIDVSHITDRGFWDVIENVDGGIFASHSNARNLCNNPRNLTDEMLKAIANKGGIVGISSYPTLLTDDPRPTIEHALDHIEYIADQIGIEHVSIGADFINYVLDFVMPKIKSTDFNGQLYGEEHFNVEGLNRIAELPNLIEGMQKRGFEDEQIDKVIAKNFLNLWQSACQRKNQKQNYLNPF